MSKKNRVKHEVVGANTEFSPKSPNNGTIPAENTKYKMEKLGINFPTTKDQRKLSTTESKSNLQKERVDIYRIIHG